MDFDKTELYPPMCLSLIFITLVLIVKRKAFNDSQYPNCTTIRHIIIPIIPIIIIIIITITGKTVQVPGD